MFQDVRSKSRQPTQECKLLKGNETPPGPKPQGFQGTLHQKIEFINFISKISSCQKINKIRAQKIYNSMVASCLDYLSNLVNLQIIEILKPNVRTKLAFKTRNNFEDDFEFFVKSTKLQAVNLCLPKIQPIMPNMA